MTWSLPVAAAKPPPLNTAWQPIAALAIVVALSLLAVSAVRSRYSKVATAATSSPTAGSAAAPKTLEPRGGLVTGYDRRRSTSKTIVYVWTAIVVWMVLTEALVALFGHPQLAKHPVGFGRWMKHTLDDPQSRNLYLIFLGGPWAAAVLAKVIVTNKVQAGTLQKADGNPSVVDVVANDSGAIDPVDFQYILFNFVVAAIVILAFWQHIADGLPTIADFLGILTGGSAATYTINKGVTSSQPTLTGIHPQTARVGDAVTVYGTNLAVVAAKDATVKVAVSGVPATVTSDAASDTITFTVPPPATGTSWNPNDRQTVMVTTAAGLTATLDSALQVVPDRPVAVRLDPKVLAVTDGADYAHLPMTIYGQFLAAPGMKAGDTGAAQVSIFNSADQSTCTATADYVDEESIAFTLPAAIGTPQPDTPLDLRVTVVRDPHPPTDRLRLTVQAAQGPILTELSYDVIIADAGAGLHNVSIEATGQHLGAPSKAEGRGGPAVAPAEHQLPLTARLSNGAALTSDPATVTSDVSASFKLPASARAPAAGDDVRQVSLVRGTLSSDPQRLTLRARAAAALDHLGPQTITVAPNTNLSDIAVRAVGANLADPSTPRTCSVAPPAIKVTVESAAGMSGDAPVKPGSEPNAVTFTLPPRWNMPAAEEQWTVTVTIGNRLVGSRPLTLTPQAAP